MKCPFCGKGTLMIYEGSHLDKLIECDNCGKRWYPKGRWYPKV